MPRPSALYPFFLGATLALSLIRYDRTILVLLLGFLILARREVGALIRAHRNLTAALAALLAWVAALCFWRADRLALQFLVQYAGAAALFLAAGAMLTAGRPAWKDRFVLLGFMIAVSLLLLVPRDILHGDFLKALRPDEPFGGRWSLVFNNPNVYGIVVATGFCVAAALWREGRLPIAALVPLGGLFLFQVAMSGSRNAVGVVGFGALALAILARGGDGERAMRLLAGFLVVSVALLVGYLAATGRLTHANESQGFGTTLDARLHAWRHGAEVVTAYPLTGIGTHAMLTGKPLSHAHNLALGIAMEFGLIGLALAVLVATLALWRAPAVALLALIPAFAGQAIDDFHFQRTVGLMTALLLAGAAFARTDRGPGASASS